MHSLGMVISITSPPALGHDAVELALIEFITIIPSIPINQPNCIKMISMTLPATAPRLQRLRLTAQERPVFPPPLTPSAQSRRPFRRDNPSSLRNN